jgi:hypothetical protein
MKVIMTECLKCLGSDLQGFVSFFRIQVRNIAHRFGSGSCLLPRANWNYLVNFLNSDGMKIWYQHHQHQWHISWKKTLSLWKGPGSIANRKVRSASAKKSARSATLVWHWLFRWVLLLCCTVHYIVITCENHAFAHLGSLLCSAVSGSNRRGTNIFCDTKLLASANTSGRDRGGGYHSGQLFLRPGRGVGRWVHQQAQIRMWDGRWFKIQDNQFCGAGATRSPKLWLEWGWSFGSGSWLLVQT